MKKGFTLIEILIVMSIIFLLSAVVFIGRSDGEKRLALDRTAYQLAQDLREIEQMAMSAEEFTCKKNVTYSFGIRFSTKKKEKNSYIIFADCNNDHKRGKGDKDIRKVSLEKGVEISALVPASPLSIVFEPPDPRVYIAQGVWNKEAQITLSFGSDTKKVKINSAGRIAIE